MRVFKFSISFSLTFQRLLQALNLDVLILGLPVKNFSVALWRKVFLELDLNRVVIVIKILHGRLFPDPVSGCEDWP